MFKDAKIKKSELIGLIIALVIALFPDFFKESGLLFIKNIISFWNLSFIIDIILILLIIFLVIIWITRIPIVKNNYLLDELMRAKIQIICKLSSFTLSILAVILIIDASIYNAIIFQDNDNMFFNNNVGCLKFIILLLVSAIINIIIYYQWRIKNLLNLKYYERRRKKSI
jgi:hypothetical protein